MTDTDITHDDTGVDTDTVAAARCSVVIAAFQRPTQLQRLIDGLADQEVAPDEVIVVDDGSARPLSPRFPDPSPISWQLLRQPNAGAGAARHTGIRAATGDIIVIVDDDMIVSPQLVSGHLAAHAGGADVVQGRFENRDDGDRPLFDRFVDSQQQRYFEICANDAAAIEPSRLATGNVSFSRERYLAVGGFDASLRRREDSEIGLRLAKDGATFGFADDSLAEHDEPPETLRQWLNVARQYGEAEVDIHERHPEHSPWVIYDDMPMPIRAAVRALSRSPRAMRAAGAAAARAGTLLERVAPEKVTIKAYGAGYALSWFSGVHEGFGPGAARSSRLQREASTDMQTLNDTHTGSGTGSRNVSPTVRFGQIDIDVMELNTAVDCIMNLTTTGQVEAVVTPNVDHVVRVTKDPAFDAAYRAAALRLADGQPLILASRFLRLPLKTKLSGSDLLVPVLSAAAQNDVPVFLFGATDASAEVAEAELRRLIPGVDIVGRASPMYTPGEPTNEEFDAALSAVEKSGARLVVLAFGTPKQEILAHELRDRLPPATYCCFGAALDFTSGTASRAPAIISKLGIEWLWRLCSEPKRLWRRYLVEDIGIFGIVARMTIDRVRGRQLVFERELPQAGAR